MTPHRNPALAQLALFVTVSASLIAMAGAGIAFWMGFLHPDPTVLAVALAAFSVLFVLAAVLVHGVLHMTVRDVGLVRALLDQLSTGHHVSDIAPLQVIEIQALADSVRRLAARDEKQREDLLTRLHADPVTGLPYRSAFFERLRHGLELARRGNSLCLAVLEVSGFDRALAVLGSESADNILRLLTTTLNQSTRKSDYVARLGVQSFAVVFYNAKGELMTPRLENLRQDFTARQQASPDTGGNALCALSIGMVYLDPRTDQRAEDVFQRANTALGAAKNAGGVHLDFTEAAN
jgi:diguanylate cyclase (GGDEF)-like protein